MNISLLRFDLVTPQFQEFAVIDVYLLVFIQTDTATAIIKLK